MDTCIRCAYTPTWFMTMAYLYYYMCVYIALTCMYMYYGMLLGQVTKNILYEKDGGKQDLKARNFIAKDHAF